MVEKKSHPRQKVIAEMGLLIQEKSVRLIRIALIRGRQDRAKTAFAWATRMEDAEKEILIPESSAVKMV